MLLNGAPYLHEDKENERLQKEIARVTEELRRTKEKLKRAEENLNCCNMAKDLRKGLKRLQLLERDRSPLGVRAATLSNKAAGPFARALLNVVFNAEELEGRSLTGRKSNAFKDTPAKEALDPIRLNAVIALQSLLESVGGYQIPLNSPTATCCSLCWRLPTSACSNGWCLPANECWSPCRGVRAVQYWRCCRGLPATICRDPGK
ncbi:hypothetical protein HPB47_018367 [Ixodes persulcatus]|uniref:Uncharacterized protein n=1 Tax=Ixodes persulcatus TaxID=34615 RepID=A0AC60QN69_IXOPE|nr:hypothetical protein HPB47_018367 [Ixodes persulcatus]